MATNALEKSDVRKHDELIRLLSFILADEECGLEVLTARETFRMPTIARLPDTARYFEGFIDVSGKIIPVVSMRAQSGLTNSENSIQAGIILMDVAGGLTGFIVDGVSDVIHTH